jgi:hypothetical protein
VVSAVCATVAGADGRRMLTVDERWAFKLAFKGYLRKKHRSGTKTAEHTARICSSSAAGTTVDEEKLKRRKSDKHKHSDELMVANRSQSVMHGDAISAEITDKTSSQKRGTDDLTVSESRSDKTSSRKIGTDDLTVSESRSDKTRSQKRGTDDLTVSESRSDKTSSRKIGTDDLTVSESRSDGKNKVGEKENLKSSHSDKGEQPKEKRSIWKNMEREILKAESVRHEGQNWNDKIENDTDDDEENATSGHLYCQLVLKRAGAVQYELHQFRTLERMQKGLPPLPFRPTTPPIPPPLHEGRPAPHEAARIHEKHYECQEQMLFDQLYGDPAEQWKLLVGSFDDPKEQKRNERMCDKSEDESTDKADPVGVLSKSSQVSVNCIVQLISHVIHKP